VKQKKLMKVSDTKKYVQLKIEAHRKVVDAIKDFSMVERLNILNSAIKLLIQYPRPKTEVK